MIIILALWLIADRSSQMMLAPTSFLKGASANTIQYHFILMYDQPPVVSLCAIESLGRVSGGKIIIWTNAMQFPAYISENVEIRTLNITCEFYGTPFQDFDFIGRHQKQNIANALRLSIVYKYGGMYMDTDFIVLRSPDDIVNGMALENEYQYNNAAFKFNRPRAPFLRACMEDFVDKYNGDLWGNQGPNLFTRVQYACKEKEATEEPENCPSTWPKESFYPITHNELSHFWSANILQLNISFALHVWNHVSVQKEKEMCRVPEVYDSTAIGMVRSAHCPKTFEVLRENCSFFPE
jgi:hypothetical protein